MLMLANKFVLFFCHFNVRIACVLKVGTPVSKKFDDTPFNGDVTCIKNNLYHIVYDDGDGKCFSKYAHVTHINTHLTFIQCLKTIEEDLSENEVRACAKAYAKKFGSKTSASATRRKQRAQYENAGSYVSVRTYYTCTFIKLFVLSCI